MRHVTRFILAINRCGITKAQGSEMTCYEISTFRKYDSPMTDMRSFSITGLWSALVSICQAVVILRHGRHVCCAGSIDGSTSDIYIVTD